MAPENAREIYLVLPLSLATNREICRGIYRYALPHKNWIFFMVHQEDFPVNPVRVNERTGGVIGRLGTPALAAAAAQLNIPVINIHGGDMMESLPLVGPDFYEVGKFAACRLLEAGFMHYAYYGLKNENFSMVTLAGFSDELRKKGHEVIVYEPKPREKIRFKPGRELPQLAWLRDLPKPVAIYSPEDVFAHELGCLCSQLHLRVPEEVALLGTHDDELYALGVQPPLSSIRLPWQEVGMQAARLLDALMSGGAPPDKPLRIGPPDFVPRQSTQFFHCRDEVVERAMLVIRQHVCHPITVEEVARLCGVSRRNLEKRFRAVLNRSPLQEYNRMRTEEIKRLLRASHQSMERISEVCGFTSPVYLSQFFSRETGISPGTYRRTFHKMGDMR